MLFDLGVDVLRAVAGWIALKLMPGLDSISPRYWKPVVRTNNIVYTSVSMIQGRATMNMRLAAFILFPLNLDGLSASSAVAVRHLEWCTNMLSYL
jgi:hypothetical protein